MSLNVILITIFLWLHILELTSLNNKCTKVNKINTHAKQNTIQFCIVCKTKNQMYIRCKNVFVKK